MFLAFSVMNKLAFSVDTVVTPTKELAHATYFIGQTKTEECLSYTLVHSLPPEDLFVAPC